MLKRLHIQNFTVFADAEFEFSEGLNVIVGTNGTGKTHLLKLAYTTELAGAEILNDEWLVQDAHNWANGLSRGLMGVFRPESIGRLVHAQAKNGRKRNPQATIIAQFLKGSQATVEYSFVANAQLTPDHRKLPITVNKFAKDTELVLPVFIPAKEILAMFTGLTSLARERAISIDQTYVELAEQLEAPLRYELDTYAKKAIASLEHVMGGRIILENGRFYFYPPKGERQAIDMVAEGFRKLATIVQLLSNGRLSPKNTLYWDEPEANLNPALLKAVAALLMTLSQAGIQVILATHSLFLLKELHIQTYRQKTNVRYFGLSAGPGEATRVSMADNLELLPDIVTLDAELAQTDRFQEVLDQSDAE